MNPRILIVLKDNIRDVAGEKLASKAKNFLKINTGKIKTGKIYIIQYPLTKEDIYKFTNLGLKDEVIHNVYINSSYKNPFYKSYILIAKKPRVTDDEGSSAQKTLVDILNIEKEPSTQYIHTEDIYFIEEDLSKKELNIITEQLLANKLIHNFEYGKYKGEISFLPDIKISKDLAINTINIFCNDEELIKLSKKMLLSLNLEEMKAIQNYYKEGKTRDLRKSKGLPVLPTQCEIEVLAQTWSEHCKHKEFAALIDYYNEETGKHKKINSLFNTYIKGATEIIKDRLERKGNNWLLKVFSDNAGVVKIDENSVFVWKVETHNSPSAIDPYGGAITGILGNNRDPLGTGIGGGKFLFNTNVLCFGPPDYKKELLPGQLHPLRIFEGVRHGIEDGGNKSGIPTVNGAIIFDERYSGKPLVYCGTGAIMPLKIGGRNSWEKKIDQGDIIIMAGGRVGKDGIHGATFSSSEIDEHSPQSAVQIGSPYTQKILADFMTEAVNKDLIKCSTDNGAGGLSSSVGELARLCGGAIVYLEKVPLKYKDLRPWEIFLSESQERMTFVIENYNKNKLFKLAKNREVELTEIGQFTASGYIEVRYKDRIVNLLDIDFLHNGVPQKHLFAKWEKPKLKEPVMPNNLNYQKVLLRLLSNYNICSRENVIRQYDHEVKGKTVVKPLMGEKGNSPQDAAVIRLNFDNYEGIAVANGICPQYGDIDPYEMSAGAFDEAVRQIISVGGKLPDINDKTCRFWSVNDNFCVPDSAYNEKTNPDGALKLAKLVKMNKALFDMSTYFNIPMTSGKDSMKNDFKAGHKKISVPPTILYSMVAKIEDIRKTITSDFKNDGDLIFVLGRTYNELGGSKFYKLYNSLGKNVPKVRKEQAKNLYQKIMKANEKELIESCHDISDGGLVIALAEATFGNRLGVEIDLSECKDLNVILFSESHSRFVASVRPENKKVFQDILKNDAFLIGKVMDNDSFVIKYNDKQIIDMKTDELERVWERGLDSK